MNGVLGLPCSMVSRQRTSARQQEPLSLPTLDTVPEPITVPLISERDLAQCAMSMGKSNVISMPALGAPDSYFDLIDKRLPGHNEDVEALRGRRILIDGGPE